ncbi:MAG: pentapeptide repeat-containing protein [Gemmatimonadetes bacterium]|nr:pentapeptide repeat-containing protein [Gemmatimonadota bacterium]
MTKKAWARFAWYALLGLVFAGSLGLLYWDQLSAWESESATIRNFAIVVFAPIGLALAIWRGAVADRQTDTAQYSLLNERYQQGAEMLGNELLSVRLGGIYALQALAMEHPKHYHVKVTQLLCAYVRYPPQDKNVRIASAFPPEDIRAALLAIGERDDTRIAIEHEVKFVPSLVGADLRKQVLHNLNFSGTQFYGANLKGAFLGKTNFGGADFIAASPSEAKILGANFSNAKLLDADLSNASAIGSDFSNADMSNGNFTGTDFAGAILTNANLTGANLAGAVFCKDGLWAEGLTQDQITFAMANPEDRQPIFDGLQDAGTGEPISWDKPPAVKQED